MMSFYYFRKRSQKKHLRAMEILKYEKERELYNGENRFFPLMWHMKYVLL